jgi:hypothetical protein
VLAEELRAGEAQVVKLRLPEGIPMPDWLHDAGGRASHNREVTLERAASADHDLLITRRGEEVVRAQAAHPGDAAWLTADGQTLIAYVASTSAEQIMLCCRSLHTAVLATEVVEIGVPDAIADQVRTSGRLTTRDFETVRDWLLAEFVLPPLPGRQHHRFAHSGGPAEDLTDGIRAFTLLGRDYVADVALTDGALRITTLTNAAGQRGRSRWPRLSTQAVRFTDESDTAKATEALRAALLGLTSDRRSYLELWQAYNELERETIVEEAKRIGVVRYQSCQVQADGHWRFQLEPGRPADEFLAALNRYKEDLPELEGSDPLPAELGGPTGKPPRGVHGQITSVHPDEHTLYLALPDDDHEPQPTGWLHRALAGDRIRLRRRDEAWDRIATDRAEMRELRLLLEGVSPPGSASRATHAHERLIDRAIRRGPDRHPPTAALRLALGTPDVLLVQGPPGTGKTRFITDLLRCLEELGGNSLHLNRTLLSSFQHEAVGNMTQKARQRGLPPTVVDSRPEHDREELRRWRDETVRRLDAYLDNNTEVERRDREVAIRESISAYRHGATRTDLLSMLDKVRELAGLDVPPALRDRLSRVIAGQRGRRSPGAVLEEVQRQAFAAAARSIRTTAVAFADDGPLCAGRALTALTAVLTDPEREMLRRAADVPPGDVPAGLLTELAGLPHRLLERVRAENPLAETPLPDPDVELLQREIADAVADAYETAPDSADEVLRVYRNDLRDDLDLVETTLVQYNAVLAATVQQADSPRMHDLFVAPNPVFDTVIVDEAARANPLDLMIPLACARTRIILVGDQKQLPHILEQKVERELRVNRDLAGLDLSTSLFERWFDQFSTERPMIRTIRLDTQFRMHPALGRFVSTAFYGGPDALLSHESTNDLLHGLPEYGAAVAGWVHVPHTEDTAPTREGRSWQRQAEANRLAAELVKLTDQDPDRLLTFGVVAFYRAQVDALKAALIAAGIGVSTEQGEFEPVPAMAWTADRQRRRLRVGTVDAFQGTEFDVVLLSVTRSAPRPDAPLTPREAVWRYGHLLRENRMCVAMSRQRRLLIAVGDLEMADRAVLPAQPGDPTRSLAEGLVAFRELCEGAHGAVVRS